MTSAASPRTGDTLPVVEHKTLLGFTYAFSRGAHDNVLLLLHGTGGDESELLDLGAWLAPGATLLSPRGRSPEGDLNRWFARHAPGVLDEDDIVRRAGELAEFVAAAAERHSFAPDHVRAVGYSNGANMAAATLLLHPATLAGACLLRPMLPLVPSQKPSLAGVPVLIASGSVDTMIPRGSAERLAQVLRDAGAVVTRNVADAGHRLENEELEGVRAWLSSLRM